MPEFFLNTEGADWFAELRDFDRGYIEAMFFTNGDTGLPNDHILNTLGVRKMTRALRDQIRAECTQFLHKNAYWLGKARQAGVDDEQLGRDLWYTRQGHGVGYWSRDELSGDNKEIGERLAKAASDTGEVYISIVPGGYITSWGGRKIKKPVEPRRVRRYGGIEPETIFGYDTHSQQEMRRYLHGRSVGYAKGDVIGKLRVTGRFGTRVGGGHTLIELACNCGSAPFFTRKSELKRGRVQSCGCLRSTSAKGFRLVYAKKQEATNVDA
jgi:hypothetical protein